MKKANIPVRTFKDYLIPYFSHTYKSALSKDEILGRIKSRTEPSRMFRAKGLFASNEATKLYEGAVTLNGFKINRISNKKKNYKSSVVIGELSGSNQNTVVKVKIRLNLLLILLVPVWGYLSTYLFVTKMNDVFYEGDFNWASLLPYAIVLLMYTVVTGSFHYNLTKDLKFLQTIIEPLDNASSGASWIIRN